VLLQRVVYVVYYLLTIYTFAAMELSLTDEQREHQSLHIDVRVE